MAWGGTSDPQEFHRAYEWFAKRVPITKPTYLQMGLKWRRYAFTVAGVAQTDMVHQVWKQTLASMEAGEHLPDYKKRMTAMLEKEWAGTVKDPAFRVQTIWRNAVQHSYNTGRYEAMSDPAVLQARPYWVFDAILDEDTTEMCRVRDGTTLLHNDAWWEVNYPPLHHRCRSAVRTASRKAGDEAPPEASDTSPAAEHPSQTGFGYRPGLNEWEPNPQDFPTTLRTAFDKKMKTMGQNLQPPLGAKPPVKKAIKKAKPPKAIHPDPDPLPPPPPKSKELHEIYMHRKLGDAKGSNPGGTYKGLDGVERYVKLYDDEAQAYSEHIANHVYRLVGGNAPESAVFTTAEGKIAYASKIVKGATKNGAKTLQELGITAARANRVLDDYVADVLTANWDAVGLTHDNILMVGSKAYRIDNGGAFLMRAQQGRKPTGAWYQITEWDNFADPNINPAYARLFQAAGGVGPEDFAERMITQIDRIEAAVTQIGGWENFVQSIAPHMDLVDRNSVIRMLTERTDQLLKVYRPLMRETIERQAAAATAGLKAGKLHYSDRPVRKIDRTIEDLANSGWAKIDKTWDDAGAWASRRQAEGVKEVVKEWSWHYSTDPQHEELRTMVAEILEHGKVRNRKGWMFYKPDVVEDMIATRRARMTAMARKYGIDFPEQLTIRRGVKDQVFMDDVYVAWADDASTMRVRHHELSSWSLAEENGFMYGDGVVFDLDIDFDDVFSAQIMDDGEYVFAYHKEREVVPMFSKPDQLIQDPKRVKVTFQGRTYTYAEREAFVKRYAEYKRGIGQPLPTKGPG